MNRKLIKSLLLLIFLLSFSFCAQMTLEEKRAAEIREAAKSIDSCIGWFKNKDFDRLFSVVAHDSNYISVHPTDKVIRGSDHFKKNSEVLKIRTSNMSGTSSKT